MSSSGASAGAELRIICGPTAAGKSSIAMALAARHGLSIVSADSRQIYRGFDIGTAKPDADDRRRVPHHGVDVANPDERWSAARWAEDADRWIAQAGASRVLVVGGTGLYLRALVAPLFESPPLDQARRAALGTELEMLSVSDLRRWVTELDPPRAHLGRTQLLRAVEVALLTGRRLSDHQRVSARPRRYRARWLLVDPAQQLQPRIATRIDESFARGWLDEVRSLAEQVPFGAPAWKACGYEVVRSLAHGGITVASARDAILIATRQYAKRQRTWFRHQLNDASDQVTAVDPLDGNCEAVVEDWWSSGAHE